MAPELSLDGVAAADLAARWAVPAVHLHAQLPSTMDVAHQLASAGAPGGTVVAAGEQTAGRGRDGRRWHSPPGGVWIAMVLRPPLATPGVVAIRAGLLVAEVVDAVLGSRVTRLKWPNDVYLDDGKVGGVLGEGRWIGDRPQWVVVGIGVNVRNAVPADVHPPAVALAQRQPGLRRIDVLDRLVPGLVARCGRPDALTADECEAFASRDVLCGRLLRAPVVGRALGVAPDGALLVETPERIAAVREGRVAPA